MSAKLVRSRRRTALFITLISATIFITTFPPIFLWANTIEPRFMGLPFALVWNISLSLLAAVFFAAWYVSESRAAALDLDVEVETGK